MNECSFFRCMLKLYMSQVEAFDQRVVAFWVVGCSINGGARKKMLPGLFWEDMVHRWGEEVALPWL